MLTTIGLMAGCPTAVTPPQVNLHPTADAGPDRNATIGERVDLNGLSSTDPDDDPLRYNWVNKGTNPPGLPVDIINSNAVIASFVPEEAGIYEFTLTVTDGRGGSDSSTVFVFVDEPPTGQCPVADAGEDQEDVYAGDMVTLDGSGSYDPNGGDLTFRWRHLTDGDPLFDDLDTAAIQFTAPELDSDQELLFELTVVNDAGCAIADTVAVIVRADEEPPGQPVPCELDADCADGDACTIDMCVDGVCVSTDVVCDPGELCNPQTGECESVGNFPPVADAGEDQMVIAGATVVLDGTGSSDPDGDAVGCTWEQTQGPDVLLSDGFSCAPTFTAPDVAESTIFVFELTVDDGELADTDSVVITVEPLPVLLGSITGVVTNALTDGFVEEATVIIEIEGGSIFDTTTETGVYALEVPQGVPQFIAVVATAEGYLPAVENVDTSLLDGGTLRLDFVLWPDSDDIIVIDTTLHHLGDDAYAGSVNSQFQLAAEGLAYEVAFTVTANQAEMGAANLRLFAKGVQEPDPIWINGQPIGILPSSPEDGSFGFVTSEDVAAYLVEGVNTLRIESALNPDNANDHDDFEFTNVHIVLEDTPPPPPTGVFISAAWGNSPENVDVDLNWQLPSGEWVEINRCSWSTSCAESVSRSVEEISDGLHFLVMDLDGSGRWTDLDFTVDFLGYHFRQEGRLQGRANRKIGINVRDGVPYVMFNGWLAADEEGSGAPSGVEVVEAIGAWRNASQTVDADINLALPSGEWVSVFRNTWDLQGFEHLALPAGIDLDDGTYQLEFYLDGGGRWADVTFMVHFLNLTLRFDERIQAREWRTLAFDVVDGVACTTFNGWVSADDEDAGGLCDNPVEITGGWRDASDNVDVDINLQLPDGQWVPVWRNTWGSQGFERIVIPDGVALDDGVYELRFYMDGSGRWADVTYQAGFLDWSFETTQRLLGRAEHSITLQVAGGSVAELTNTWTD